MDRITDRALIEVRRNKDDALIITSATAPAERLLGVAHGTLLGEAWGPQFEASDAVIVLNGCRSVLDRRRHAWTGAAQPANRAGRPVHVTVTKPPGSVGSRLQVELIEAAPHTPTVGTTETDTSPDERWLTRDRRASGRRPGPGRALTATDLDRAKSEFIAAVNHELRTPLTSIIGYADVLLDASAGDLSPLQASMIARVKGNGRRLLKQVENLLTLSSIQSGSFQLERRTVDLATVVRASAERSGNEIQTAGLEVTLELGRDQVPVVGDETQLGRVVTSLIDNAIAFTPPGGTVRIAVRREEDDTVLEVADTGVGIPACDQADLFQRFARAPGARAQEAQGLGLGLAVLGSIVASHGGHTTLTSTPGAGTVVTVHLPCAAGYRTLLPLQPRAAADGDAQRAAAS